MYLKTLKLWNFRIFGTENSFDMTKPNIELEFNSKLNVLIGENDSGKSAIIDSIKMVLKTHSYENIRVVDDDFYKNSEHLRIELILTDIQDEEAKHFIEYLGWTGEGESATPYLRVILDVKRSLVEGKIFPYDARAGVDEDGAMLSAEARELLKVTYLKPLRDAEQELIPKRNSRLSQILYGHEAFRGHDENHYLIQQLKYLNETIEKYFEGKKVSVNEDMQFQYNELDEDKHGSEIKSEIDRLLKKFYNSKSSSRFGVWGGGLRNLLEKLELSIENVINPGLGTLNRLFMASELLHLNQKQGLKLGLIEEVEAHLHPQVQMQVIETLQEEADNNKIQLILTTHSPNIASKIKLANLILCYKGQTYSMALGYTELKDNDRLFLEKFLDTTKANLFFANGVIFVEGWVEEIILPSLAKAMGINLTEKKISIVNIGGTAFLRYAKIFLRKNPPFLDIPIAIITDLDVKPDEEEQLEEEKTKKQLAVERKEKEFNDQNNRVFISEHWTLEYCIAKSKSLSGLLKEVISLVHPEFDVAHLLEGIEDKLRKRTLDKTGLAYELAKAIDDKIIQRRVGDLLKEDEKDINYLMEAIKYVSKS